MQRTSSLPPPAAAAEQAGGVDVATGLLAGAVQVLCPHRDERPAGAALELIVVHGISLPAGEFGGPWIDRLFCGELAAYPGFADVAALRVSAHALIRRDGAIRQYVPFGARAWHAGQSSWRGRGACNDFSVGIELEGTDHVPYTDAQYAALAALIGALRAAYPSLAAGAAADRVTGHSDIAPARKSDPGPIFDWPRLHARLHAAS